MKLSDNRLLVIRRIIFAVMIVLDAVLQQTDFLLSRVGPARLMLLVPLTVAIAMYEKSLPEENPAAVHRILIDGKCNTH